MVLRPVQRATQIPARFWLVQPAFIVGDDLSRPYEPYPGLLFLDENLPTGKFLAE